jgi:hypothetical protein
MLVRTGMGLERAIVEAEPVPNMLEFFAAMRRSIPEAQHFFLTARTRSMRGATLSWLERYGLELTDHAVCLVPRADVKPRIWAQLARDARLVIVDDLSYDHESDQPSIYDDLVESARRTASVYIGFDEISEITANPSSNEAVATQTTEAVSAGVELDH